ncbi:hypothetical protein pipiens_020015 [Culex pipiens pipiens]|uniref:Uncharacterized protein n=1 Tax=Culex pipiens pipiens TaxID=38569 RepID=A0ABD1DPS7_CULPP
MLHGIHLVRCFGECHRAESQARRDRASLGWRIFTEPSTRRIQDPKTIGTNRGQNSSCRRAGVFSAGPVEERFSRAVAERIPTGRDPKNVESGGRTFLKLAELEFEVSCNVHSKKTISAIHRAESEPRRSQEAGTNEITTKAGVEPTRTVFLLTLSGQALRANTTSTWSCLSRSSSFPVKTLKKLMRFLSVNRGKNFVRRHGREIQRFIQKQVLDRTIVEYDVHMWHHNKESLLAFWFGLENALLVANCPDITRNSAFYYKFANHDDLEIASNIQAMLPVYHDLLRMFCQDPVWAASCGREESRILRGRLRNEILQAAVEMSSAAIA